MDFASALALTTTAVKLFVQYAPQVEAGVSTAISAYKLAKPFAAAFLAELTGTALTSDQRTLLEAKIDEMSDEFQALTPPAGATA